VSTGRSAAKEEVRRVGMGMELGGVKGRGSALSAQAQGLTGIGADGRF